MDKALRTRLTAHTPRIAARRRAAPSKDNPDARFPTTRSRSAPRVRRRRRRGRGRRGQARRRAPSPVAPPSLHILSQEEIVGDEDDEELDEDENAGDSTRPRVPSLITGALGQYRPEAPRAWSDVYDLVLIDRHAPPGDDEVIVADLANWDESWVAYFDDVDTVIHLAGNPDEFAPWDALVGPNADAASPSVFHASAFGEVERVIFASSNHAMGGYRDLGDMPITIALRPGPTALTAARSSRASEWAGAWPRRST